MPISIRRLIFAILIAAVCGTPASALRLIRDAEIEASLAKIAEPVLRAAGLNPSSIRIIIVENPEMNAFVAGRNRIFIHTGMLRRLDRVEMIQAVIAHEVAHITAGHQISRRVAGRNASATSALGVALSVLALSAGAGEAALPLALGTKQAAERSYLAHTRAEEASADQAGVRYLAAAGIDPQAAIDALALFRGQELLPQSRIDPYAQTHPLSTRRIRLLEEAVRSVRIAKVKPDPSLDYWAARMRAKFDGFIGLVSRDQGGKDELSLYRRAIQAHRRADGRALSLIGQLISMRPNDPFYHELRGQILYETGKLDGAVASYRQAAKLRPRDPLITTGLGLALLAQETSRGTKEALGILEKAKSRDGANPRLLQALALAYGRRGDTGRAALVTAERFALSGRMKDAGLQARRAAGILPEGSPGWRQAQDIIAAATRLKQ